MNFVQRFDCFVSGVSWCDDEQRTLEVVIQWHCRLNKPPILRIAFWCKSDHLKSKRLNCFVYTDPNWTSKMIDFTHACATITKLNKPLSYHWKWWSRFTYFQFYQSSHRCQFSMAVKYKLNDVTWLAQILTLIHCWRE